METLSARAMEGCGVVIVVCSTYGKGQVPDNAVGFYNDLRDIRPDLTRMQFGVVALGDKRYARTFANGGKRFAALFEELGARQIGDLMEHDASSAIIPEDAALAWLRCWVPQMQGAQK